MKEMKNFKSLLLVVAAASLLTACGDQPGNSTEESLNPGDSTEESLNPGASVMGGVVIDYTSDANLLTASVFGDYSGAFIYTPLENTKVQIVPTFSGKNTLDYAEINGTRYEAKIGTADTKVRTYMGELSLEGIPYIEYTMTSAVPNVKLHSKATDGTTHKVTVAIDDKTVDIDKLDTEANEWTKITGSKLDSYFGKEGTHTVEILEGAMGGFLIQGADLENYHKGYFGYAASSKETTVAWNTLEASINNTMKTASIFKMPAKDVTINVSMSNAVKVGKAYALVHGAGYVGKATASYTVDYHGNKALAAVTLHEYCLPSYITVADTTGMAESDYVTGTVTDHGNDVQKTFYKTMTYGETTLTASIADKKVTYTDAEGANPFLTEEGCEAWATAVENNAVTVKLAAGDRTVGHAEFSKDENGYGGTKFDWEMNRDATVAMAMDYDIDVALAATKEGSSDGKHWVVDGVETGATWTDLNTVKEGSTSYLQLIKNAMDKALNAK